MDLDLSEGAADVRDAARRWVQRNAGRYAGAAFDRALWRDFLSLGVIDATGDQALEAQVAAFTEVAQLGLPGPWLECVVALDAGGDEVRQALTEGNVVTSVAAGPPGPTVVGWGAVADVVVDQASGAVVARGPLPAVHSAFPVPHGWWTRPAPLREPTVSARQWVLGAGLLVGLARGAIDLTVVHTMNREQFGHPLAQNQAIQFPLAEAVVFVESCRIAAFDAAARLDTNDEQGEVAAALAWLSATRAAETVISVCHQSFGALGFCVEAGLVERTWPMSWLLLSVGKRQAHKKVVGSRRSQHSNGGPESLVLRGFRSGGNSASVSTGRT
jgi:Acyl-CoA dehydrogenase, C-terminal domain